MSEPNDRPDEFENLSRHGCDSCGVGPYELCPPCRVEYTKRFAEVPDIFSPAALANQRPITKTEGGRFLIGIDEGDASGSWTSETAFTPLADLRKLRDEMIPGVSVDRLHVTPEIARRIEEAKEHCRLMRTSPVYWVRYQATVACIAIVRALRWILRGGRN